MALMFHQPSPNRCGFHGVGQPSASVSRAVLFTFSRGLCKHKAPMQNGGTGTKTCDIGRFFHINPYDSWHFFLQFKFELQFWV